MRRRSWLVGIPLALAACYEVGDLREVDDAGSGGSANQGGSGGGWSAASGVGGGTGGSTPQDAAAEQAGTGGATAGAAGAQGDGSAGESSSSDAASDAVVSPPWQSCKALGFGGKCIGESTLIYFRGANACDASVDDTCYINRCASIGGSCVSEACSNGYSCSIYSAQLAETCTKFGTDGACVDNAAIRVNAAGTDCEFKDCEALKLTCVDGPTSPADCF